MFEKNHLNPRMGKGLPDAHAFLWLVDEQVGDEVLRLAGDVLPELKVEVDIAHLDTLKCFAIVLPRERRNVIVTVGAVSRNEKTIYILILPV